MYLQQQYIEFIRRPAVSSPTRTPYAILTETAIKNPITAEEMQREDVNDGGYIMRFFSNLENWRRGIFNNLEGVTRFSRAYGDGSGLYAYVARILNLAKAQYELEISQMRESGTQDPYGARGHYGAAGEGAEEGGRRRRKTKARRRRVRRTTRSRR